MIVVCKSGQVPVAFAAELQRSSVHVVMRAVAADVVRVHCLQREAVYVRICQRVCMCERE